MHHHGPLNHGCRGWAPLLEACCSMKRARCCIRSWLCLIWILSGRSSTDNTRSFLTMAARLSRTLKGTGWVPYKTYIWFIVNCFEEWYGGILVVTPTTHVRLVSKALRSTPVPPLGLTCLLFWVLPFVADVVEIWWPQVFLYWYWGHDVVLDIYL